MTSLSIPPPTPLTVQPSATPNPAALGPGGGAAPVPGGVAAPARSFAAVLHATTAAPITAPAPSAAQPSSPGPVGKMLTDVAAGHREMERLIQLASSGRSFSSAQLLGLQARIYRLSNEIDMASKLLEKVTSGVKQAMSTQV